MGRSTTWRHRIIDSVRRRMDGLGRAVQGRPVSGSRIIPFVVDGMLAVDIDDAQSLGLAEARARHLGFTDAADTT